MSNYELLNTFINALCELGFAEFFFTCRIGDLEWEFMTWNAVANTYNHMINWTITICKKNGLDNSPPFVKIQGLPNRKGNQWLKEYIYCIKNYHLINNIP